MDSMEVEFDIDIYRERYDDLLFLSDAQLWDHFKTYGQKEGRFTASLSNREQFADFIKQEESILEIGPFFRPLVYGEGVQYFDVLNTDQLKKRAIKMGIDEISVPNIDFYSNSGDLGVVDGIYNAVVSSHCIEHQPDLIGHLNKVSALLNGKGRYYVIVPNKFYCFDHYIAESSIAEVIQAGEEERRIHTLNSVIEHRALITHNDAALHWKGCHGSLASPAVIAEKINEAIEEYKASKGLYIDVHAWQFTPRSFRYIIDALFAMGLIDLYLERVYSTPYGRDEFTAVLRKKS